MEVQEERKPKSLLAKTYDYWKKNGAKKCAKTIYMKFFRLEEVSFRQWQKGALPTQRDLERQKDAHFQTEPVISLAVPLYRTPEPYLKEMIQSVRNQTYGKWQLCLADGSGDGKSDGDGTGSGDGKSSGDGTGDRDGKGSRSGSLEETVKRLAEHDERICYQNLGENRGIAGNTNAALAMATGDYVALLDHDDMLAPDALYEIVKCINQHPGADVIYTDEDKVDEKGKKYYEPHFKPDFNLDLLRTMNYICHLFVVKRELADRTGGFRSEYDGAQDYDFIFRCTEQAKEIRHVPKLLYHWRCHRGSTAQNPASKQYAFDAGLRVIQDHYRRMGIQATVSHGIKPGMYHTIYERPSDPLVSVIIPNKDHIRDLDLCISSLMEKSSYQNLEIIVVENNSTDPETFDYYEQKEKEMDNLRVVEWKGEGGFNYPAINNYGVSFARGEYLLLLNNDIEMIDGCCVEELLGHCMRPDVAIAGARLYYGDDTIQHAGVIVGLGGVAGHAFVGLPRSEWGYMAKAVATQDLSAVTAACMMVKKEVYLDVGGMTEALAVAFNDVDFCLKVREKGWLVVYEPYAQAYHYESKSRGLENTPEKLERFHGEMRLFRDRWKTILEEGDPYYNINLTLDRNDFTLRNPYWMPVEF